MLSLLRSASLRGGRPFIDPRLFSTTSSAHDANKRVRVACGSGFWGDTPTATAQLVGAGGVDYIIYDYLSEVTMSLLTAAMQKKPEMGYAPDFVKYAMGPQLKGIKEKGCVLRSKSFGPFQNLDSCIIATTTFRHKDNHQCWWHQHGLVRECPEGGLLQTGRRLEDSRGLRGQSHAEAGRAPRQGRHQGDVHGHGVAHAHSLHDGLLRGRTDSEGPAGIEVLA